VVWQAVRAKFGRCSSEHSGEQIDVGYARWRHRGASPPGEGPAGRLSSFSALGLFNRSRLLEIPRVGPLPRPLQTSRVCGSRHRYCPACLVVSRQAATSLSGELLFSGRCCGACCAFIRAPPLGAGLAPALRSVWRESHGFLVPGTGHSTFPELQTPCYRASRALRLPVQGSS
jgi:hypothetical protein